MASKRHDKPVGNLIAELPDQSEIRRRIAHNLQERQLLRQLLRLAEKKAVVESFGGEAARD